MTSTELTYKYETWYMGDTVDEDIYLEYKKSNVRITREIQLKSNQQSADFLLEANIIDSEHLVLCDANFIQNIIVSIKTFEAQRKLRGESNNQLER